MPPPKLLIVRSSYRRLVEPIHKQVSRLRHQFPGRQLVVTIPETVEMHWWNNLLHRRRAARLRRALWKRGDCHVIVVTVPWYVKD